MAVNVKKRKKKTPQIKNGRVVREKGGRGLYCIINGNTRKQVEDLVDQMVEFAGTYNLPQIEIMSIQESPAGGWEAVIRAHNWNPIKWAAKSAGKTRAKVSGLGTSVKDSVDTAKGKVKGQVGRVKLAYKEGRGETFPESDPGSTAVGPRIAQKKVSKTKSGVLGIGSKIKRKVSSVKEARELKKERESLIGYDKYGQENIPGWSGMGEEQKWNALTAAFGTSAVEGDAKKLGRHFYKTSKEAEKVKIEALKYGVPTEMEPKYKYVYRPAHKEYIKDPTTGVEKEVFVDATYEPVLIQKGRKLTAAELQRNIAEAEMTKEMLAQIRDARRERKYAPLKAVAKGAESVVANVASSPFLTAGEAGKRGAVPTKIAGGDYLFKVPIIAPVGFPPSESGNLSHLRQATIPRLRRRI